MPLHPTSFEKLDQTLTGRLRKFINNLKEVFILEKLKRVQIAEGVYFNTIFDNRFKTSRIAVTMLVGLDKDKVAANAIVPNILTRSCKAYPTYFEFSQKLDMLYGTSITGINSKMGDFQALTLYAVGIDDKYSLDGESVNKEMAEIICDVLFDPNVENGEFKEEDFKQEQRQLIEAIDAQFNNKRAYSMKRFLEVMFKDEKYGINKYGTKEQVLALTSKDAYNAYLEIIKTAKVEIMCLGSNDNDDVCRLFKEKFSSIERDFAEGENVVVPRATEVKEQTDRLDVEQSKLILGFRTDCAEPSDKVSGMKLTSAVLGGTAHSKLFNNVREKLSLCYYCSSAYDSNKGLLYIESGVQKENIEKAKAAILNEIEEMKKGNITDEEMTSTKLSLCNKYMTSVDSPSGTQAWYLAQMLKGKPISPQEQAELINAVTKEQVVAAANKLTLDTVYVLTKNDSEEEN